MSNRDSNNIYRGKGYICLARESDDSQKQPSTEAQEIFLRSECDKLGMIFVDIIALKGVTGSLPGNRQDLENLLKRKREKNDFEVVVAQRCDRMTRSGAVHGFWFKHECARVGLRVKYVGDDIPEGRYGTFIEMLKLEAALEEAIAKSQRGTQGAQLALEQGRNATCAHTPYGCWRLYLTTDGKMSHIIRDMGDGRQEKLHPETFERIDIYGAVGGGSVGHYRKQKSELVLLMPGDSNEIEVVHLIFRLHFVDGWGGKRIADLLNVKEIPSPWGKEWSQRQVEVIYQQEAYTGRTVGNHETSALFHERRSQAPKPVQVDVDVDLQTVTTAKVLPKRYRPRSEWFIQVQPMLHDFLDPQIRQMAMAEHEGLWRKHEERLDPNRPRPPQQSKNKHKDSQYILTELLTAKQDGETLSGMLSWSADRKVRYYRHRRGRRGYRKGSIFNNLIPAQPLEQEVLRVMKEVLLDLPDLEEKLGQYVRQEIAAAGDAEANVADLQRQRERLSKKLGMIIANFDSDVLDEAKAQVSQIKAELRALDERIAATGSSKEVASLKEADVVAAVLGDLQNLATGLPSLAPHLVRQVLTNLLDKAVVDMATKAVEIEFRLPGWAVSQKNSGEGLRLVSSRPSSTSYGTQTPGGAVFLGFADCRYVMASSRVCYECRRRPAA